MQLFANGFVLQQQLTILMGSLNSIQNLLEYCLCNGTPLLSHFSSLEFLVFSCILLAVKYQFMALFLSIALLLFPIITFQISILHPSLPVISIFNLQLSLSLFFSFTFPILAMHILLFSPVSSNISTYFSSICHIYI